MVHAYNTSTWESEVGKLSISDPNRLHSFALSKTYNNIKNKVIQRQSL